MFYPGGGDFFIGLGEGEQVDIFDGETKQVMQTVTFPRTPVPHKPINILFVETLNMLVILFTGQLLGIYSAQSCP